MIVVNEEGSRDLCGSPRDCVKASRSNLMELPRRSYTLHQHSEGHAALLPRNGLPLLPGSQPSV